MIPALLAFIAGMAAFLGLLHIATAVGAEHRTRHLAMGSLALALGCYTLLSTALYATFDPERYALLARWQGGVAIVVAISAYWFAAFYTGLRPWPLLALVTLALVILLGLDVASEAGIFFGHVARLGQVRLPWGETVPVPVATPNPLERWFDILFWPFPVFAGYALARQYRRGDRRDAVLLAVALCTVLIPAFVDTFVLGVAVFPFPFTEVSFILLLTVMSLAFPDGIVRLARARRALEHSELTSRALVEAAPDGIAIVDGTTGEVTQLNPEGRRMLGLDREQPPGDVRAFLATTGRGALTTERLLDVAERSLGGDTQVIETTLCRIDGSDFPVEVRCGALPADPARKLLRVSFLDISDRLEARSRERLLTEQLHHAQKLETLGTLAGGIAHDFNNLLTPILGCSELSLMSATPGSEEYENLSLIRVSAERSRDLVQQILAFSRRGVTPRGTAFVEDAVKQALRLLGSSRPANIEVVPRLRAPGVRVPLDPTQIQQVVINLATNAMQAMPQGGRLGVTLTRAPSPEGDAPPVPEEVLLEVADTGTGIDPAIVDRIFDPFFTTKPVREGTGLGLSVVYGIVTAAGGRVEVSSRPGAGATFRVRLPTASEEPTVVDARPAPPSGTTRRVLVIDDNGATLETLRRMTSGIGHDVTAFSDAAHALDVFERAPADFDVVLLDYDMAPMNGGELGRRIRELRPDVRIVCTSGSEVLSLAREVDAFVAKPPTLRELERALGT
jgi:PAS domain S-box-containing protein